MIVQPLTEVLGINIKALRVEAEITQQSLAEEMVQMGFPWRRETVAQSEGEGRTVTLAELLALCMIFHRPLDAFLLPQETPGVRPVKAVSISRELDLSRLQLLRLIRQGDAIPRSDKERRRHRLVSQINSAQLRLSKSDERLLDLEDAREKFRSELLELQQALRNLDEGR